MKAQEEQPNIVVKKWHSEVIKVQYIGSSQEQDSFVRFDVERDVLYKVVENLFKKIKFMELYRDLCDDLVSESEFEEEVKANQDKYVIDTTSHITQEELKAIYAIMSKYKRFFDSEHDAREVFGISSHFSLKSID